MSDNPFSAALRPNIPLAVKVPQAQAAASNPFQALGTLALVQNQLNQARLFQQTFQAKAIAGGILAQAPNLDAGVEALFANPQVMAFAPEIPNIVRQTQMTETQIAGARQTQALTATAALQKSLAMTYNNPEALPEVLAANMAMLPQGAAGAAAKEAMMDFVSAVVPKGLQGQAALDKFHTNLAGAFTASGMSPDMQAGVTGQVVAPFSTGGQLHVGAVARPAALGGGLAAGGTALPMTQAPGYQAPGTIPVGGALGPYGAAAATGGGVAPSAVAIPPDARPTIPIPAGVGGLPDISANPYTKELATEFAGPEQRAYSNAVATKGSLLEMNSAFDELVKGGGSGFLTPGGLGAQFRTNAAKSINSFYQMIGQSPPFDPSKVAWTEDITKNMNRMRLTVLTQLLGNQREAAETIQSMEQAVPGINNSFLGAKVVMSMLNAGSQRLIDERNFKNAWSQKFGGNLSGAAEAFNNAKPATSYVADAFGSLGMTPGGAFQTPEAVRHAVQMGWMTRSQGVKALETQWPNGHPQGAAP